MPRYYINEHTTCFKCFNQPPLLKSFAEIFRVQGKQLCCFFNAKTKKQAFAVTFVVFSLLVWNHRMSDPLCRVQQSRLASLCSSNTRALEMLISCSSEGAAFFCQLRSQVKTIIVGKLCLKIYDVHLIYISFSLNPPPSPQPSLTAHYGTFNKCLWGHFHFFGVGVLRKKKTAML